jgi:hypothetical protein
MTQFYKETHFLSQDFLSLIAQFYVLILLMHIS